MIVAAMPLEPPVDGKCFAFYVINDTKVRIDRVVVEAVSYEWGDFGNSETLDLDCGPVAPGAALEVYRETDTEVRTAITLRVRDASGERRVLAEVGRLYYPPSGVETIPVLNRAGKRATLEVLTAAS